MNFAKWVFRLAGIYGLIVLTPNFFLERQIGQSDPPPITHPEYFYGFTITAIAWQVAFLLISCDPARYRPLMILAAVFEKAPFAIAVPVLFALGRTSGFVVGFAMVDLTWAVLFAVAYRRTKETPAPPV